MTPTVCSITRTTASRPCGWANGSCTSPTATVRWADAPAAPDAEGFADFGTAGWTADDILERFSFLDDVVSRPLTPRRLKRMVERALDARSSMAAVGNLAAYQAYQIGSSMPVAAENPAGGLAGAGLVALLGLVMGIMIIPFISSLSDDVINAVPQALRDGALALGATRSETVRQVVIPQEDRPTRKEYHLTDAGYVELMRWLSEPVMSGGGARVCVIWEG